MEEWRIFSEIRFSEVEFLSIVKQKIFGEKFGLFQKKVVILQSIAES